MIFGWGHKYKHIGNAFRTPCIRCDNVVDWELYEIEYYYHILFIPISTYKSKYRIICPMCSQEYPNDSIQYNWLYRRAEIYESLEKSEITLEDYKKKLRDLRELEKKEAKEQEIPTEEEIREIIEEE